MPRIAASISILASIVLLLGQTGCGPKAADIGSKGGQSTAGSDEHADHLHGDDGPSDMDKMKAELAKLSPEDAASAAKQHVCPVSGEMLGVMGAPEKVDVNGRQVWICCDGCRDKLLSDPEPYLAKLPQE
jgi:hypothetical protein